MATSRISEVIQHLRKIVLLRDGAHLTDGQLLESFVSRREAAALEVLVQRHARMVWGVCRRILQSHHDAEDAFQATFLVLVRKAAAIMPRQMVANWLYGVAHQTALKARATRGKRQARERQVTNMLELEAVERQDLWPDLQPLLDEELSRLPDKYRVAIVLCDLEGKTRKEAARQLGVPDGTLAARLSRGRTMLAKRLARHGLAVSGGTLAAVLSQQAVLGCVPTSVMTSTIKAINLFAAGQVAATALVSTGVVALTDGVVKAMLLNKIMKATAVLALGMLGLIGAGTAGLAYRTQAAEPPMTRAATPKKDAVESDTPDSKKDEQQKPPKKDKEAVPIEQFTGRLGVRQGDSIAVTFDVDERSFLRYQRLLRLGQVKGEGSPLYLGLSDENDFPHRGTLKGFDDHIDPKTGTVQAQGSLPNADRLLLPGMFVRVRMPFGIVQNEPAPRPTEPKKEKGVEGNAKEQAKTKKWSGYSFFENVDAAKRTITLSRKVPFGRESHISEMVGDKEVLAVMPTTKIIIDGKEAKLEDLQNIRYNEDAWKKVYMDWEYEVSGPTQDGKLTRIEAIGDQVRGLVQAINVFENTITTKDKGVRFGPFRNTIVEDRAAKVYVATYAEVIVDGKAAKFAELKPNMKVTLQLSAVQNVVIGITAYGATVKAVVKTVHAEKNTISVNIPSAQIAAEAVPVAKDAKVLIDGKEGKLSDLKAGMRVTLQMTAEPEQSLVVGVTKEKD